MAVLRRHGIVIPGWGVLTRATVAERTLRLSLAYRFVAVDPAQVYIGLVQAEHVYTHLTQEHILRWRNVRRIAPRAEFRQHSVVLLEHALIRAMVLGFMVRQPFVRRLAVGRPSLHRIIAK